VEAADWSSESGVAAVLGFASPVGWVAAVVDGFADSGIESDPVREFHFSGEADGAA